MRGIRFVTGCSCGKSSARAIGRKAARKLDEGARKAAIVVGRVTLFHANRGSIDE